MFRVLVVDDDPTIASEEKARWFVNLRGQHDIAEIDVKFANSKEVAKQKIESYFFDLALVDLDLGNGINEGEEVLTHLLAFRPTCFRIVLTNRIGEGEAAASKIFNPDRVLASGFIPKESGWHEIIPRLAHKGNKVISQIINPEVVVEHFEKRLDKNESRVRSRQLESQLVNEGLSPALSNQEVSWLVKQAFLGRANDLAPFGEDAEPTTLKLELSRIGDGRSAACVLATTPCMSQGEIARDGLKVVLKFAPREDVILEAANYEKYIKFQVKSRRRVELLSAIPGDIIGVLCYGFAGGNAGDIGTLEQYVVGSDVTFVNDCIDSLLGPQAYDLHSNPGKSIELGTYFKQRFGENLSGDRISSELRERCMTIADSSKELHFDIRSMTLSTGSGISLKIPDVTFLRTYVLNAETKTCVSHGDLHAGNVIVHSITDQSSMETTLIDFRDSGYCPRSLDYAIMDLSLRLPLHFTDEDVLPVFKQGKREADCWKYAWSKMAKVSKEKSYENFEDWQKMSAHLCQKAQEAFKVDPITEEEYAQTLMMCALRLLPYQFVPLGGKVRLLAIVSSLCDRLRELNSQT